MHPNELPCENTTALSRTTPAVSYICLIHQCMSTFLHRSTTRQNSVPQKHWNTLKPSCSTSATLTRWHNLIPRVVQELLSPQTEVNSVFFFLMEQRTGKVLWVPTFLVLKVVGPSFAWASTTHEQIATACLRKLNYFWRLYFQLQRCIKAAQPHFQRSEGFENFEQQRC